MSQINDTKLHNTSQLNLKLAAALAWMDQGAALLPTQPNSKFLIGGFGPYQKKIATERQARRYFGDDSALNMAVVLPAGVVVLDFDSDSAYWEWINRLEGEALEAVVNTRIEHTPRGAHVFLRCDIPENAIPVDGVEVKRHCIVSPSEIDGRSYIANGPEGIASISDWSSLVIFVLSESPKKEKAPAAELSQPGEDVVSRIKAALPVKDYAKDLTELKSSDKGAGRWYKGCCPFHDDHNPSLWLDSDRDLWGCHACGAKGDVINLHAKRKEITIQAAIRDLAGVLDA